jgi:hypothetical protein
MASANVYFLFNVLGAFALLCKVAITFTTYIFLSARLPACIRAGPTGLIFEKFDVGEFHENWLRNSKFGYNRAKILVTLDEGLIQVMLHIKIITILQSLLLHYRYILS